MTLCKRCHKETYKGNKQYGKNSEIFGIDRKVIFNPHMYKQLNKIKECYLKGLITLDELCFLSKDEFDSRLHDEIIKRGIYTYDNN